MIIHWLIPGNYNSVEDLSKSNLASIRMRAGLVAKYASDIQVQLTVGDHINSNADVIMVGKIGGDCQNGRANLWMKQITEAQAKVNELAKPKAHTFSVVAVN